MYLPPHFHEVDPTAIAQVMQDAPLACIAAQTAEGLIANHFPLLASPDGTLIGHAAIANDMHRIIADGQEVLTIFRGADAYVSANYYPSKADNHRSVPTWNYQVVHVYGTITFQHDDHAKRAAVGLLTRLHERRVNGAQGWRMADAPADYMAQKLAEIVAFRVQPTRIIAKFKLSQNRDARDYDGVIKGLESSGQTDTAARMKDRAPVAP